jgi:uncharacterized protein (TIGR01777 family)
MKIVLAGATGFLGTPLVDRLVHDRHEIVVLSRSGGTGRVGARVVRWTPDGTAGTWGAEIDGADAVVNLAGESIAARRWTAAQKQRILDSRVLATRSLVKAIFAARAKPSAFVSGSAVGYYGALDDRVVTEDQPPGTDFLARVGAAWEAEAQAAATVSRVVLVRTGIVLERSGGALPKMLPPFWIGAGGPVGSGRQFWPWIHRQDWIDLVRFAIESSAASGPLNATAPTPVTNRDFATALGRALHRPAWLPTPGFALKLLLGEMAEGLLLSGQRAVPDKALRLGFTFQYPTLDGALAAIFARRIS